MKSYERIYNLLREGNWMSDKDLEQYKGRPSRNKVNKKDRPRDIKKDPKRFIAAMRRNKGKAKGSWVDKNAEKHWGPQQPSPSSASKKTKASANRWKKKQADSNTKKFTGGSYPEQRGK